MIQSSVAQVHGASAFGSSCGDDLGWRERELVGQLSKGINADRNARALQELGKNGAAAPSADDCGAIARRPCCVALDPRAQRQRRGRF